MMTLKDHRAAMEKERLAMECSCEIRYGDFHEGGIVDDVISYCPKHAAADEMLLCLKLIKVSLNSVRGNFPHSFAAIEQAIKDAEPTDRPEVK